jgi:glycosyltransferase involved in cell wall biosynthesis
LDISRLVYGGFSPTPTGVGRVELAYAEYFLTHAPDRLRFVVVDAVGRFRLLENRIAVSFVRRIAAYWRDEIPVPRAHWKIAAMAHSIHAFLLVRPGGDLGRLVARRRCIYVIPSQLHLEKAAVFERLKRTGNLKLVYFVHDILPTLLPEYFLPDAEERTRRRLATAARHADLVVTNSHTTARALRERFGPDVPSARIVAAPIGVTVPEPAGQPRAPADRPYFVSIGTLEPRKNHLLLLNLWRSLREEVGDALPRLFLIGGRGWENENAVDMLERSPGIRGIVEERRRVSDREAADLLRGARAILLPSFAEGFGMPLAEALALGVPALCSDIPAFREVGGGVPDYLDPLDGKGWRAAILDYAASGSPGRAAQLERLASWQRPTWSRHFAVLQAALDSLAWPAAGH